MGRVPPPNYYGRRLATGLKRLRVKADLLQQEVAGQAHFTLQKVSRIESGQVPGYYELRALLDIYGVPVSEWPPYLDLWTEARKRRWWLKYGLQDDEYIPLEDVAAVKYEFQLGQLPTLLQTADYAHAVAAPDDKIVGRSVRGPVAALMGRVGSIIGPAHDGR
jgi:transcriptional regulator with XRE-family HTH domain